ncbi:MAG TPA: hypothetical protein PLV92_26495, partial [Pirellulaceae bacterium]|nr:hypothetical protein [Pirellulaceae bacterium]
EVSGGVGNYWLGISNPTPDVGSLSNVTFTDATFGVRGDIQSWSFTATANQALGWAYEGQSIQNWKVVGPNGQVVAQGAGGGLTTIAFTPASTGTHRLVIEDVKATTLTSVGSVGPFTYRLTPAVVAPLDQRINGRLDVEPEVDLFAVPGQAGQRITISAYFGSELNANDGGLDGSGSIRLIGPDGAVVATLGNQATTAQVCCWTTRNDHRFSRLDEFELPVSGMFFVEVSGGVGNYWLGISNPTPDIRFLEPSNSSNDTFGVRGDQEAWTFRVKAGERPQLRYSGAVALDSWTVLDARGNVVAGGSNASSPVVISFEPPAKGQYSLVLRDAHDSPITSPAAIGAFAYQLARLDVPGSVLSDDDHGNEFAHATPITVDSRTTGAINYAYDPDWFRFEAEAGATYEFGTDIG